MSIESAFAETRGSFNKISQYEWTNVELTDGKHPAWVYYETKGNLIVRIEMPTLDLCAVTPISSADHDILSKHSNTPMQKGSEDWTMALKIWKVAFEKYMLVGEPASCN